MPSALRIIVGQARFDCPRPPHATSNTAAVTAPFVHILRRVADLAPWGARSRCRHDDERGDAVAMAGPVPQAIIQAGQLGTIAKGQFCGYRAKCVRPHRIVTAIGEPSAMRRLSQLKAWGRERVTTRFV